MPRKKAEPEQLTKNDPVVQAIVEATGGIALPETDATLVSQYITTRDWIAEESKRFAAHLQPYKAKMEAIENEFLRRLNERGQDASPTEHGTAYKSTLLNVALSPEGAEYNGMTGRDAFLDYCMEFWDTFGNEALLFSPQKDAIKKFMEENEGRLPPGIKTSFFTKVNVRRS